MQYHKFANLFPLIEGDEFEQLKQDIQKNGQLEPVWLYEGQILDGRNRYRACSSLGIEAETREYEGDEPLSFVLSLNLHRRHLSASQKAILTLEVLPLFEARAKERQVDAGRLFGENHPQEVQTLVSEPLEPKPQARDHVAAIVGVQSSAMIC